MVLLEIFFRHLSLDDHEAGIDEGLFEELALEHPHEVFDSYIFSRRPFYYSSVCLYLLLLRKSLLWVGLALFSESLLVLLEQLCRLFESVLRILAVNAFVIKFSG